MHLNKSCPYSISFRYHFLIAAILGIIVVFIIVFLHPLGSNNFTSPFKTLYFTGYGIIVFFTYLIAVIFSNGYYLRFKIWKWIEELIFCLFFIIIAIIIAFFYTEVIINKKPERLTLILFLNWFKMVFLGFGVIMFVVTVLLRNYYKSMNNVISEKRKPAVEQSKIKLKGTLKKELFSVEETSIVYVRSEDNYVYIYYVEEELLKEKMLRNTLTNIEKQLSSLIKAHRSYLINPDFIILLKGNAQNAKLQLKNIEDYIPVSKTYFASVKNTIN
ncbi:LytTR family DNA-binding domain-containing protein [Aquimarina sp. AU58]|uniref:LytTR family DNA-binding domain-containing protein n=1 Tax=Aquimarina sp. AU58 TaxID=1874112 RepID=UPI000D65EE6A|nr:LytTR family DNA-binding domain-containing protein [Aquimarina sp. AU58]